MRLLAAIIALELIFSVNVLNLAAHPKTLNKTKNKIGHVLGIKLAQAEDAPPADSLPPADSAPSPAPAENSPPPASGDTQPSSFTTPGNEPSPETAASPAPSLFDVEINPSISPEAQPSASPNPESSIPVDQTTAGETQTQAVLNGNDLINSTDNINTQSQEEAKKEEDQIEKTANPKEQTNLLIDFATDKVKDIAKFSKNDDFASTNFAATRFNSQIDQAIVNLDKVSEKDKTQLKKRLVDFCRQADQVLRTVELSVPEESQQDFQIARGQCFELDL